MHTRAEFTGLIVEDEFLLRLELAEELSRAGWRIIEVATGEEALALLAAGEHIDFLVTDIRLPGAADGWAVAEAARARDPALPVLYVSANPINETRRAANSVFLDKPVQLGILLEACDRLVLGK